MLSVWFVWEHSDGGWEAFAKGVGFKVGEGTGVCFLVGDWLGVGPFSFCFLRLCRVASCIELSVKVYYVGAGGFVSWDMSYIGGLC